MLRNLIIAVGILALLFGVWTQVNLPTQTMKPFDIVSGTVFTDAREFNEFELIDTDHNAFNKSNFKGQWNLVFFGFTNCQMICPTTLSDLNKTYKKLEKIGKTPLPQVVLISVDPERDTPEKMKEYLLSFNQNFKGATGNRDTIKTLTRELGVIYAKMQSDEENYDIDHSGAILVINPEGKWQALFTTPHNPDEMANDLNRIMKQLSVKS